METEDNEELVKFIRSYQERLDKYVARNHEEKILYYLSRLKKLPIKTVHLETTGVGRSVNGLKKLGGTIGNAAKEVVAAWKMMVLAEEKAAEDAEENAEGEEEEEEEEVEGKAASDSRSENELNIDETRSSSSGVESEAESDRKREEVRKRKDRDKSSESPPTTKKQKSHKKRRCSSESEKEEKSKRQRQSSDDESEEEDRKHKSKKSKSKHHRRDSSDDGHHHKSKSSSSKSSSKSSKTSNDKSGECDNKREHREKSASSHKSKSSDRDREKSHKHKSDKSDKSKDKSRHSNGKHKDKSHKSSNSSSSSDKKRDSATSATSSTVKLVSNEKMINGIDSGSGASFAEALGMCGPPLVTGKNKKKSSSSSSDKSHAGKTSYVPAATLPSTSKQPEIDVPLILKEPELEPLNLNIDNLLPEITPNYRPLGLPVDFGTKKVLSDEEALSRVMSNRNQKTKVYSGNKVRGKLDTLFDLCVRVLQDNIDALEYTGGVPYSILKPILDKATAEQLFNLEHHNPYLIEDTNELWKLHCQKEFRTKKREEMESWREMYLRCLEEREAKLNAVTATIKQAQEKSVPVRTAKLAYIDSVAKPPRNIARKQMKNGIANVEKSKTTAAKLSALATAGEAGKVAVPNPGSRAVDRSSNSMSSSSAVKPKKAPLMAKTLSFLKNRFRR